MNACQDLHYRLKLSISSSSCCFASGRPRTSCRAGQSRQPFVSHEWLRRPSVQFRSLPAIKAWQARRVGPAPIAEARGLVQDESPADPAAERSTPRMPSGVPVARRPQGCVTKGLATPSLRGSSASRAKAFKKFSATIVSQLNTSVEKISCVQNQPMRSLASGGRNER